MKKGYTALVVVMDTSGSMGSIASDMEGGFNRLVKEQQEVEAGTCDVSLVQFSSYVEERYTGKDVLKVEPIKMIADGMTALNDAIGMTIERQGARFRSMREEDRPEKVVFIIITDGEENNSRKFSTQKVRDMIAHQQQKYGWEFVYLAANVDTFKEAGARGIQSVNTISYLPDALSTRALYMQTSSKLTDFRVGASATMSFTDDERQKVMDASKNIAQPPSLPTP